MVGRPTNRVAPPLVRDLVWSTQPELARAHRDRLVRIVPQLVDRLKRGLVSIDYPAAQAKLFLDHLAVIDQVAQFIGRRHHLDADAIEELQSTIRLKIIENDYEVLRKFEGRSSLRTYLTAIVQRHFLDSREQVVLDASLDYIQLNKAQTTLAALDQEKQYADKYG